MKTTTKLYRAALYMRLSKDDDGVSESSSIGTQRKMLRSFAEENGFLIHDEYIDDGFSGTNFDRPDFQRMIQDIEAGYVNLVIVKDLSRLGREYIMTGQYTEMYFPEHNVRFIAINDGCDSINPYNDIAPFKHVINEMYARDTSKKIRSAFKTKMKEGAYIGNFAPYGYRKDPADKNHLLIDYDVAPVVQEMFYMAENGSAPSQIAQTFNQRGIATPAVYRCEKHPYLDVDHYSQRKEWTSAMVCKMLKNIVYLGHIAQGKTTKVSFKSKITLQNQRDEWYIVENTHEPLISQETFDIVRNRCVSRKNAPTKGFKNVFSGIAKCMDCQRNMSTSGTRKKGSVANLVCGGYKLYGSRECSNHFIDYETLYDVVLQELRKQVSLSAKEKREIIDTVEQEHKDTDAEQEKKKALAALETRTKELDKIIQRLYEDNAAGKINDERLNRMLATYEAEQKTITAKADRLTKKESNPAKESRESFFKLLEGITEIDELTPDLLHRLIDHIEIGQGTYEESELEGERGRKHQVVKIFYRFVGNLSEQTIA